MRRQAWDTTVVSRLVPDSPAYQEVLDAAQDGLPIAVPTAVLSEVSFGVARAADRNPSLVDAHNWLLDLIDTGLLESLPLTAEAAEVAGELRARQPTPPTADRKRDASKPEQRVGWVLDLFVGATAWVHGCDVVTYNNHDFERIAQLLPAADDDSRLLVASPAP